MTSVNFLKRTIFPIDLRAHYMYDQEHLYYLFDNRSPGLDSPAVLSLALTLAATLLSLNLWGSKNGHVCQAWLNYLACWLPVSGIIQHGDVTQFGGNRYAYFPMTFGLAPVVCIALSYISESVPRKRLLLLPAVCLLLGYSFVSNHFLLTWSGDKMLLDHCLTLDPSDAVCQKFASDYYGHHENDGIRALLHRRKELELVAKADREYMLGTNDWLYMGTPVR